MGDLDRIRIGDREHLSEPDWMIIRGDRDRDR